MCDVQLHSPSSAHHWKTAIKLLAFGTVAQRLTIDRGADRGAKLDHAVDGVERNAERVGLLLRRSNASEEQQCQENLGATWEQNTVI